MRGTFFVLFSYFFVPELFCFQFISFFSFISYTCAGEERPRGWTLVHPFWRRVQIYSYEKNEINEKSLDSMIYATKKVRRDYEKRVAGTMDAELVWERLLAEGVRIWLDARGQLRIEKEAPEELKQLVREHKPELIAVLKAQEVLNLSGIRLVRLPLGHFALAKRPGPLPEEAAAAIRTLRLDHLPVVRNDEGGRWMPYEEWRRRQPVCDPKKLDEWRKEPGGGGRAGSAPA